MTALVEGRPPGLDALFRPGDPFVMRLAWPAGFLAGRTWQAALDAAELEVDVVGDEMTVSASAAQTAAAAARGAFALTETTATPVDRIIGRWSPSLGAAQSAAADVAVYADGAPVGVTVLDTGSYQAVADVDARLALIESRNLVVGPYTTIPSGFGRRWYPSLADAIAGTGKSVAVSLGDSVPVGWRAEPDWLAGYGGQVGDALQAVGGDGGPGFLGVDFIRHTGNNLVPGNPFTVSGNSAWTTQTSDAGSINAHSVRPTTVATGWMAFTLETSDELTIYSRTDPSYGTYTYSIDGAAAVPVSQAVAAGIQATTVAVTPGTHTVQIASTVGTCRILGVRSEHDTGVVHHNMSVAGRQTDDLPTSTGALAATFAAIGNDPDVVIVTLGVNDLGTAGRTQAEVDGWLETIARTVRGLNAADPADLVFVIQHRGNATFGDANGVWPGVYSAISRVAERNGAALIDMWGEGRRSWDVWAAQSRWGNSNTDVVHPSNAGHTAYADAVLAVLLAEVDA